MTVTNAATGTLIHALQRENDSLRHQLYQSHQEIERLSRKLRYILDEKHSLNQGRSGCGNDSCTGRSSRNITEHVVRLEHRCEQLTSRLVSMVRDRHLSECTEVFFLLRTQEEERRFLRDALLTLLKKCKCLTKGVSDAGDEQLEDGTQPGVLSALIMRVVGSVQSCEAQIKLEQAERLVVLEQTNGLIVDIQHAIQQAARLVYNHHISASHATLIHQMNLCEGPRSRVGEKAAPVFLDMTPNRPPLVPLHVDQSDIATGSAQRYYESASDNTVNPIFSSPKEARESLEDNPRRNSLLEACDMLRACHRALEAACLLVGSAMSAPATLSSSSLGVKKKKKDVCSVERLLEGFQHDLLELTRSSSNNQEAMARRLAREIEAHRQTVKKYEARLKLAEKELVDCLTATSYFTKLSDGLNDTSLIPLHHHHHHLTGRLDDVDPTLKNGNSCARPRSGERSSSSSSSFAAMNRCDVEEEAIRRKSTPERLVPPTRRDSQRSRRCDPDLDERRRDSLQGGSAVSFGSRNRKQPYQMQSTSDTLDTTYSYSTDEVSLTQSPRRERYGAKGKTIEGPSVSTKRDVTWKRQTGLFSPSVS